MAPRFFALVPAAGRSRRMGRPKLLLPLGESTLIELVLEAWRDARVDATIVVLRSGQLQLGQICRQRGAEVVSPTIAPPDMRASIQCALKHLTATHQPQPHDYWLLAPADANRLSSEAIRRTMDACRSHRPPIAVARFSSHRGHPTAFGWPLAEEVARLSAGEGVNGLLRRFPVLEVACEDLPSPGDIDTPDDYRRAAANREPD